MKERKIYKIAKGYKRVTIFCSNQHGQLVRTSTSTPNPGTKLKERIAIINETLVEEGFVVTSDVSKKQPKVSKSGEPALRRALLVAKNALVELASHDAFAGRAPEFNDGGVGREALKKIKKALGEPVS